jgi:hypothetical protein
LGPIEKLRGAFLCKGAWLLVLAVLVVAGCFWFGSYAPVGLLWLKLNAHLGNSNAQFALGQYYASGGTQVGTDVMSYNPKPAMQAQAIGWFRKAAEQDNANAQCRLGYFYQNGFGVPKDSAQASNWWQKAAMNWRGPAVAGDPEAQLWLGVMNRNGWGAPKNEVEAYKWYALGKWDVALKSLAETMAPEQIREGELRVEAFHAKNTATIHK